MSDFLVRADPASGRVASVQLYGQELLDPADPCADELRVNGLPLKTRLYPGERLDNRQPEHRVRLKGERFVDHFAGWGLVVTRSMGERPYASHPCFGVQYVLRREPADATDLPCPGPGGPPIEAPLYVDTFTLLNWNWRFWGDDTRMIFASAHSSGPADELGHVGYEHDTPEQCKRFMQNVWRRTYPGTLVLHGGLFYNVRSGHWLAITCRRPGLGYILNLDSAGRGLAYDFTLHAPFPPGETLVMPEIKLYWGESVESMWAFMADYVGHYYVEPPKWFHGTLWAEGLAWNNQPTWRQQADLWERQLDAGDFTGISYCLVTNRPVRSGTTPLGYEPDPNHGSLDEFKAMCRRLADRGVPLLIWMSHSGLMYRGGPDIDDDWFIRGIDGRTCASWGHADQPELCHINPGHPGYIAYTKKWIRFYIAECGAKGIWFDCLGWVFPPDFRPRPFMRYPGDTNRMAIRFLEEIHAFVKELDPEAVIGGEGCTFDAPLELPSICHNPVRASDGRGPRDFLLELNRHGRKRFVLDQGPRFSVAGGMPRALPGTENADHNRLLARLLHEHGGDAWTRLPGELAVLEHERLLVVPAIGEADGRTVNQQFRLPPPFDRARSLTDATDGTAYPRGADGAFHDVPAGVYRLA
ncbi:MAG: hypothetical protein BWZ02_01131 [Lentisphaerae bacterium ADurb.BinA184]|nr:MAG: hypothetical protein BWZ02_01131 [Lentisphaerae bacterium ADurb.BinA184]